MSVANELLERLDKLQTTELGIVRIKLYPLSRTF